MTIDLPWPPSAGKADIKSFRLAVDTRISFVLGRRPTRLISQLRITVKLFPPDNRHRNLLNTIKTLRDALEYAGLFYDSTQIDELHVYTLHPEPHGRVLVEIAKI